MILKRIILLLSALVLAGNTQAFMFNLKNANIRTLINTVSIATGKNFIIDPRVKGTINVITSADIDDEQLYHLFLAVMRIHGFVVVDGKDFSKILPKNLTKSESAKQLSSTSDEIISTVIAIKNVNAAKIVPIVRPLMSQYGHLAAYDVSNSLIVVDSSSNIERLKGLLEKLDKTTDTDFETIKLKYTPVAEMAEIIKTLIIGKNSGGTINLVIDKHNNQMVIGGSESKRLKIRLLVAELDKKQDDISGISVVYLNYANAKNILPTLQSIAKQTDTDASKTKGGKVKNSMIAVNESTNSIIINGSPEVERNIKHVIKKLDIRRAQVLIEAIIAEISLSDARELGLQWVSKGNSGLGIFNANNLLGSILAATENTTAIPLGATIAAGNVNDNNGNGFGLILSALQSSGKANILSTPLIVTLDNNEAEIIVGQEVPFLTKTTYGNNNSNPFQNFERKDVGLKLKVKPQINNGSSIKLEIEQETSNVLPSSSAADVITSKRSIKTTVIIEDGQLLVLGGLVDETWRNNETKVPGLGDIPILGSLFTHTSKTKEKRNLLVFIRPTILTNINVANKVSSRKYKYIQAFQLLKSDDDTPLEADDIFPTVNKKKLVNSKKKLINSKKKLVNNEIITSNFNLVQKLDEASLFNDEQFFDDNDDF